MSNRNPDTDFVLPVAAIDQGNFATKIAPGRDEHGSIEVISFPSHLASIPGPRLIEMPAGDCPTGVIVSVDNAWYYSGEDVLDTFRTPPQRKVDAQWITSADYKGLFQASLAHIARHHRIVRRMVIRVLVLGLPFSSFSAHAGTLVRMACGVHSVQGVDGPIEIRVEHVIVVAQPQGAMYLAAVKRGAAAREMNIVTTDMGGGTHDWLYGRGLKLTQDRCGTTPSGTLALAEAAARVIDPKLVNNPLALERIDTALRCNKGSVRLNATTISLDQCWPAIDKVLDDTWTQLNKAVDNWVAVDLIHVAGGGVGPTMRMLNRHLAKLNQNFLSVIEQAPDARTANVRGFFVIGETQVALSPSPRTFRV